MTESKNAKRSHSKAVLVIDNTPLKRAALAKASVWLQKIRIIENSMHQFNEVDLKLYSDWYNLSIQPILSEIEKLQQQFVKAATALNAIIFLAQRKKISLPEAHIFLEDEQVRYEDGDSNMKAKIDQARLKRDKQLQRELDPYSDDDDISDDDDESDFDDESADLKHEDEKVKKARQKYKKQIEYYQNLSDEKIESLTKYFDEGIEFAMEAIKVLTQAAHPEILRRIWKRLPAKIKKYLNKSAAENTGMNFEDLINDLADRKKEREDFFNSKDSKRSSPPEKKAFSPAAESHQLRLKSLYRKIVRRIHPDNLKSDSTSELKIWFDQTWEKVMKAYHDEDVDTLHAMYNKIILILNEHHELSIAEIHSAAESLKQEYEVLAASYHDLKDSPAWNFSGLKDYKKIEKKVFRPYHQQKQSLYDDLSDLKKQQTEIEYIARLQRKGDVGIRPSIGKRRRSKGRSRG